MHFHITICLIVVAVPRGAALHGYRRSKIRSTKETLCGECNPTVPKGKTYRIFSRTECPRIGEPIFIDSPISPISQVCLANKNAPQHTKRTNADLVVFKEQTEKRHFGVYLGKKDIYKDWNCRRACKKPGKNKDSVLLYVAQTSCKAVSCNDVFVVDGKGKLINDEISVYGSTDSQIDTKIYEIKPTWAARVYCDAGKMNQKVCQCETEYDTKENTCSKDEYCHHVIKHIDHVPDEDITLIKVAHCNKFDKCQLTKDEQPRKCFCGEETCPEGYYCVEPKMPNLSDDEKKDFRYCHAAKNNCPSSKQRNPFKRCRCGNVVCERNKFCHNANNNPSCSDSAFEMGGRN